MSEMLGNHYFLIRDYAEAIKAYSTAFNKNLPNSITKKIIICHLTQDDFSSAQNYFINLIKEDPALIYDTDFKLEECPCYDLIKEYEAGSINTNNEIIRLGILWFYCDLQISKKYFEMALKKNLANKFIHETLDIINTITKQKEKREI